MASRENEKERIVEDLADQIAGKLLQMKPGSRCSIADLVREIYRPMGYTFVHMGSEMGYVWTKDSGKTYSITDWEQEEVMERVAKKIKGKRRMDLSEYRGRIAGTPHNLQFVLRKSIL